MNKFFCRLTGGHKYDDGKLTVGYDSFIGAFVRNHCVKCGTKYFATIDLHALVERDIEEYKKRHRKDGADNE